MASPSISEVERYLGSFVKANKLPGLSAALVVDGNLAWTGGFGSDGRGGRMAGSTRMRIGSLSKSFTALAILSLAREGRLDLDAPLRRYLPWFEVKGDSSGEISIRHLLTHTSGLSEMGDPDPNPKDASLEEEVRSLSRCEPFAPPGKAYRYYNKNYRALGLVIETVSGKSYGAYLGDTLFRPLGLNSASSDAHDMHMLAAGSVPFFSIPVPVDLPGGPGEAPAGGIAMSAADMGRYLASLVAGDGSRFLPDITAPSPAKESRYGLGWRVEEGGRILSHGGDVEGFHAFAMADLGGKNALVVLCRQNGVAQMLGCYDELPLAMRTLLAGKTPAPPASSAWLTAILIAVAFLALADQARLFIRLPAYLSRARIKSPARRVLSLLPGFILPLATFLFLPALAASLLGLRGGWMDFLRFMPDLAVLILLTQALTLLRAAMRAACLARGGERRYIGPMNREIIYSGD